MSRALALLSFLASAWTFAAAPGLPVYPGTKLTRIGNDLVIDGELYRIAYFVTKDSPEDVARYFHHEFHREGVPTTVDGDLREGGVVSAFYTRDGIQRSVVVRKHGQKTVGFSVIHDLWVTAPPPPEPNAFKLEGTLFSADLSTRADGKGQGSKTLLVERDMGSVREEVRKRLAAEGFTAVRESGSTVDGVPHYLLEHAKGGVRILTTLGEVDANLTAVMQTRLKGAP